MKKVRFESPIRRDISKIMEARECHSPRPFIGKTLDANDTGLCYEYQGIGRINVDTSQRLELNNSTPNVNYTLQSKVQTSPPFEPSSDLELSIFDNSNVKTLSYSSPLINKPYKTNIENVQNIPKHLKSIQSQDQSVPPNILKKDDGFFIRPRTSTDVFNFLNQDLLLMPQSITNEKHPLQLNISRPSPKLNKESLYASHSCQYNNKENASPALLHKQQRTIACRRQSNNSCQWSVQKQFCQQQQCHCELYKTSPCKFQMQLCEQNYQEVENCCCKLPKRKLQNNNYIEEKTRAVEHFENDKHKQLDEKDISHDGVVAKLNEPTVADLFNIIKIQNEQLKELQNKVDTFISNTKFSNEQHSQPISLENCRTEQVAIETVHENHKISIGVMTSFEMVRTSTFINKEVSKHQTAQVQCDASQLNVKENEECGKTAVVSEQRFLEGITPFDYNNAIDQNKNNFNNIGNAEKPNGQSSNDSDEKSVDDLSLCNLNIDNAITPQLSPDQTMYLDVRDYSDSDDDNSNVGWTYYNKVMTRVNGMLQDSDMPSSASAMCRNNARYMQMQIDKSNVSVTKRVTFGDAPMQPIYNPTTETSMKMNQLAAKYLKDIPTTKSVQQPLFRAHQIVDMSLATRNYMEKHQLLKGSREREGAQVAIPRFLDITALKQQPKLL